MGSRFNNLEEIILKFTSDINKHFGKDVDSIILYGSAATDEFVSKKSDINFLVCLSKDGINHLTKVKGKIGEWQKSRISLPLFLTKSYIKASIDTFPIEFFNISYAYRILYGEDILKDLKIEKKYLRLQCERELKGKLLKLRQNYLMASGKIKEMRKLCSDSIVTFISIFRALLFLKNVEGNLNKMDIILSTCREFGLDESLFSVLLAEKKYGIKISGKSLEDTLQKYINQINKLSEIVDAM